MRKKLDWVDVLNEQTRWQSRADFHTWFNGLVGKQRTALLDGTVEGFLEALGYMRRQVANLHFEEPVDLLWLDTQLKTVTLGLLHHQGAQEGADSQMPRFRARVKGMIDSDLLRATKDTLLIQFAEFVGDSMDGIGYRTVSRCEGLVRRGSAPPTSEGAQYGSELEKRWREEIKLLSRGTPSVQEIDRCVNLFSGGPKTRYCSDACRFATFQIAKSVEEPGYLAEKQRRYRRRQEKQAE